MIFTELPIKGLVLIQPRIFEDDRGYFFESFNKDEMKQNGIIEEFVQDNQSCSKKNVLRGLHYQVPPHAQGKLVRVITGSVLDVAVDIRKNSPFFGKYYSIILDDKEKKMLYIPPGFAHGFVSLEDNTVFSYKCTALYHPASERTILWNDSHVNIDWGVFDPIIAKKDFEGDSFAKYSLFPQFE
ncbi:MAG: dTDP-4-dehydrorhamnose 3,5-epimerase [Bacteroidota bacterium]